MTIRRSSKHHHAGEPGRARNHLLARRAAQALAALTLLGLLAGTAAARDAASGLPTGKRMHKPFVITGTATGKRSYKPITIRKQYDKSTPVLAAPSKPSGGVSKGGLLDGNATGGAATGPASIGSPVNRGGGSAGRVN